MFNVAVLLYKLRVKKIADFVMPQDASQLRSQQTSKQFLANKYKYVLISVRSKTKKKE